jgi:hypothetical protein
VNRAFSAGRFFIPTILGHRPRLSNERCALGALENFKAVMPQLYELLKLQNDFAAAFALRGVRDRGFDFGEWISSFDFCF